MTPGWMRAGGGGQERERVTRKDEGGRRCVCASLASACAEARGRDGSDSDSEVSVCAVMGPNG